MSSVAWRERQSTLTLDRVLPRLIGQFAGDAGWSAVEHRIRAHFPVLFRELFAIYGERYDFLYHLEAILTAAIRMALARPADLRVLDTAREARPDWFIDHAHVGGVCYVDLFAGNLHGVRAKIPYFKELGLTYLHLMPLFKAPEANSDGGYAVSSYRDVDPKLGTMADLAVLASELRREGISLVLDFVFNHTSDEHCWAEAARAGDPDYLEFYYTFTDRTMPDAYEQNLREIFPDEHPGAFTYFPAISRWVWTTFHTFQWDLNYSNPAVFTAMLEELLVLANVGVEVIRLDAVAFIWKQLGTGCENLPHAHTLIRAFNAAVRIGAPALIFKSEAIVHPDDVVKYISPQEAQLSYNPLLMALLWNTLATRDVRLLRASMQQRLALPPGTAWVNYVRGHDDIGWTFSDEDAALLGICGDDHRRFLNAFYTGDHVGSFARGLPFQFNPKTGDMRISGTGASLAGLEKALREEGEHAVEFAIRRIVLIHAIILSIGGLPLLYLGDEIGTRNDYSYREHPGKADDSRWVHRPAADAAAFARRHDPTTVEGQLFARLQQLIILRKASPALGGTHTEVLDNTDDQVFAFARRNGAETLLVVANCGEQPQTLAGNTLRLYGYAYSFRDLIGGGTYTAAKHVALAPYQVLWLAPVPGEGSI